MDAVNTYACTHVMCALSRQKQNRGSVKPPERERERLLTLTGRAGGQGNREPRSRGRVEVGEEGLSLSPPRACESS